MNWKNVIKGISRFSLIFTFSPITQKLGVTAKNIFQIRNQLSIQKYTRIQNKNIRFFGRN